MAHDFAPEDTKRLLAMLEAIVKDRALLSQMAVADRKAVLIAAGRISRPTRDENRRAAKAFRVVQRKEVVAHDRGVRAATALRVTRTQEVYEAPPALPGGSAAPPDVGELLQPRACYVCKAEFTKVHFFYDAMCGACAELNYKKRSQTANLAGRVAVITGARLKIGYQAALMMLRAGAHVVVTTRFPRDAAGRYAREADFHAWKDRLEVHGLDLRHSPSVELFARYLTRTLPRLDILINNAAQTVRRPPGFYTHLVRAETLALGEVLPAARHVLMAHEACKQALAGTAPRLEELEASGGLAARDGGYVSWGGDGPGTGIRASALLSQLPCAFDDASDDEAVFPRGKTDQDLQQVDLRRMNSWRMTLAEVPSPEMLEVQLVNAVAPFILCAKLKDLMLREPTFDRHIVNVSAMEGQFARHTKTDKHPHTNMAKAALNMMTLTSAPDYAASGIFMNAVDTGWVTDEDPAALSARKRDLHDFQPPLDIVDGAARVCDPFFSGLLSGTHVWGKFLKDYGPVPW